MEEQFNYTFRFPEGSLITTRDNPYNPHTDYDKWYIWDMDHGYNTPQYQARLINLPVDALDYIVDIAIDQSLVYMIENDLFDIYKVIKPND